MNQRGRTVLAAAVMGLWAVVMIPLYLVSFLTDDEERDTDVKKPVPSVKGVRSNCIFDDDEVWGRAESETPLGLGASMADTEKVFGDGLDVSNGDGFCVVVMTMHDQGHSVDLGFRDGACHQVTVKRSDDGELTDDQVKYMLLKYGGAGKWEDVQDASLLRIRNGGDAVAELRNGNRTLLISSAQCLRTSQYEAELWSKSKASEMPTSSTTDACLVGTTRESFEKAWRMLIDNDKAALERLVANDARVKILPAGVRVYVERGWSVVEIRPVGDTRTYWTRRTFLTQN